MSRAYTLPHASIANEICAKFRSDPKLCTVTVAKRRTCYVIDAGNLDSVHCFHKESASGVDRSEPRPLFTVIPNHWKVMVFLEDKFWLCEIQYSTKTLGKMEYRFSLLDQTTYEPDCNAVWYKSSTGAINNAPAVLEHFRSKPRKEGEREVPWHNGKLVFGIHYLELQHYLRTYYAERMTSMKATLRPEVYANLEKWMSGPLGIQTMSSRRRFAVRAQERRNGMKLITDAAVAISKSEHPKPSEPAESLVPYSLPPKKRVKVQAEPCLLPPPSMTAVTDHVVVELTAMRTAHELAKNHPSIELKTIQLLLEYAPFVSELKTIRAHDFDLFVNVIRSKSREFITTKPTTLFPFFDVGEVKTQMERRALMYLNKRVGNTFLTAYDHISEEAFLVRFVL